MSVSSKRSETFWLKTRFCLRLRCLHALIHTITIHTHIQDPESISTNVYKKIGLRVRFILVSLAVRFLLALLYEITTEKSAQIKI